MKYKISIVSYLNSLPFAYGLENYKQIKESIILSKDIPAKGADKFKNNICDIALVPVGSLPYISNYNIITDYCIGAEKKVDTVLLLSKKEIKNINKIYLDYQSRTSVKLIKILANKYWKIYPEWINTTENLDKKIKQINSALIIGDRAFEYKKYFKFSYDLANQWYKFTNLPFAFAVWVSKLNINNEFINKFNNALKYGVDNINKITLPDNAKINNTVFKDYLTNKISYKFDVNKKNAVKKYLELISDIDIK